MKTLKELLDAGAEILAKKQAKRNADQERYEALCKFYANQLAEKLDIDPAWVIYDPEGQEDPWFWVNIPGCAFICVFVVVVQDDDDKEIAVQTREHLLSIKKGKLFACEVAPDNTILRGRFQVDLEFFDEFPLAVVAAHGHYSTPDPAGGGQ